MFLVVLSTLAALAADPTYIPLRSEVFAAAPEIPWPEGSLGCVVTAIVGTDGRVVHVEAVRDGACAPAVLEAVHAAAFAPFSLDGQPAKAALQARRSDDRTAFEWEPAPTITPDETPAWPKGTVGEGVTRCVVRATVDVRGRASAVADCPSPYSEAAVAWAEKQAFPIGPIDDGPLVVALAVDYAAAGNGGRAHIEGPARVKRRVFPETPPNVYLSPLATASCRARVFVNETGDVDDVVIEQCDAGYERSTQVALRRWKWAPEWQDGQAVATEKVINVMYKRG